MNQSAHRIPVALTRHPYEVVIREKGLNYVGEELLKAGADKGEKVLIVSNKDVADHYAEAFIECLVKSGFDPHLLIIQAGEEQKNTATIALIHDAAYKAKLERGSFIIALGGGVVGDMAGFAAATWLRGVSIVQVPTTLLAMVDAAIGGKTGVNHIGGKNLIGAFHQPKLVLIDPETLMTLPEREFRAGMAEVIKYGVICRPELFKLLEEIPTLDRLETIKKNILERIIYSSASSKAEIVALDELESGIRAKLNYGHTFGHVVETLCGYGTWLHGEAVSIGMVAIGELALLKGIWNEVDANRQKALLIKAGLPTHWPKINSESVLRILELDKKVKKGKIRFILPTKIGSVEMRDDISIDEIKECLSRL